MVCNMSRAQRNVSGVLIVTLFTLIVYLNMEKEFSWMTLFVPFVGGLIAVAFLETAINKDTWVTSIFFLFAIILLVLYVWIGLWVVALTLFCLLFLGHVFEK